jgi:hypothetical protein
MASNSAILGAAGEHYVMSRLLMRGMIAALAPVNAPNADIVVTNKIGDRLCAIQVKARKQPRQGWLMNAKHEGLVSPRLFYCFVDFSEAAPACWVVPSAVAAEAISTAHKAWLKTPGKKGRPHNPTPMRYFADHYDLLKNYPFGWLDKYRDGWDLLEKVT